ncbi:peroxisomal membrane protein [Toxoplasma gondii GAB2-2007-GAL-DOM2]|uniref:Peroxisomal membrane protein PEX16 n=5 Tax=Toxoplasma gondii TaxID=5811 RepID=B9QI10_TOXGV|nr:peroxisomal membrane protein [Toxoplasma gondii VEG]KFG30997.1 peroxisomal membrane protein [Toxoplasma gondii GAB2-2007-GAL-DOM2]KFG43423.1 peroxisomal membrane protein [Toxoplasma gondii p89]KFH04104.1 peroxisomal membrane protein [Toxoplasma gondii VAND]PUA84658.1 peroxisomal membrane protein [Toxoplasma gondii TgCATBr9]
MFSRFSLLMGEFLYHFRPILHLILLRRAFRQPERRWRGMAGTSLFEGLWLPWVVALVMDILSYNLVQKGLVQEWGEPQCERGATASRHPVDERGYPLSTAEKFEQAELQNRTVEAFLVYRHLYFTTSGT